MKSKKRIAIILYAVYALALTLVLLLGKSVSESLILKLENKLKQKHITDVTIDIDPREELLAGEYYYPHYVAHGDFRGDPGLVYTSLDPELLSVSWSGKLYAYPKFDTDFIDASIKITSLYDEDFEKVMTFRFVKKYPENYTPTVFVKGYGEAEDTLCVGVPVYVFPKIDEDEKYNAKNYKVEYDENYFDLTEDGYLIPVRATENGETVSFSVVFANGNGKVTASYQVKDAITVESFDGIKLGKGSMIATKGKETRLTLYKDGEPLMSDYTLTIDGEPITIDKDGSFTLDTLGSKTAAVTLKNGYTKTFIIEVRNVVSLPVLSDHPNATEFDMLDTDVRRFWFEFDRDVTYDTVSYEYDTEEMILTVSSRSFTITPMKAGEIHLKLIVDDGFTREEMILTFNVKRNMNPIAMLTKHVGAFVSKFLGHIMMFAFLALLALNMFRYFRVENIYKRFILYSMTALPIAVLTECVQWFIPERDGRLADVLIDMTGFYLGTAAVLFVVFAVTCVRMRLARRSSEKKTRLNGTRVL